jgi:hypothetical protein
MNKELRMEMENQGNLLETMNAEIDALKGANQLAEGDNTLRWCAFIVEYLDYTMEEIISVCGRICHKQKPERRVCAMWKMPSREQGLEAKKSFKIFNTRVGGG